MLLISRDSEHAAVADEGAELELGKPDEGAGQEPVGLHIGQGALSPFGRFLPSIVMRCLRVRNFASLGDLIAVPGLDTLRLGGLLNPLNRSSIQIPVGLSLNGCPG
jgi:hypothetical protein